MGWFPSLDALGGTSGKRLRAGPMTLAQLKAGTSRLIESFPYDYGRILAASDVANGWLREPLTMPEKNKKVIIIGCGMSGLLAARELLRAGLTVEIYDRDRLDQSDANWKRHHYGRACSDIRTFGGGTPDTVCELGGMRFPVKAKATWQVFSEAFDDNQLFKPFPNPGVVPTILSEKGVAYPWHANGTEAPDLPPQFKKVADAVVAAMMGLEDDQGTSSRDVIGLLGQTELTPEEEARLKNYWDYMVQHFDNMTFGAWIHEYVALVNDWTPDDLARFFNLGFGTGGMGSLFPVGFLEMLRIWIWDYADEYALPPGEGLGSVAHAIRTKLETRYGASGTNTLSIFEQHEVQEIGQLTSDSASVGYPAILVRDLTATGDAGYNLRAKYADFMVVAVPHTAAIPMTSLTSDRSYPRNDTRFGLTIDGVPCYFLSYFNSAQNSQAFSKYIRPQQNAIARLNMVNASKSFFAMRSAPWKMSGNWRTVDRLPVQCVLSEGWSRASYFLEVEAGNPDSPCAALLSYTWNLDSNKTRAVLGVAKSRENFASPLGGTELSSWFEATPEWWRAYRLAAAVMPYAVGNPSDRGTVTRLLSQYDPTRPLFGDETGIDWQDAPGATGGFKLDAAGDFQTSNTLAYAYLLTQENAFTGEEARWKTYQRIHFASCSASNYGGWCEGAFMAGANAAIGVLAAINKDKLKPEPAEILKGNPFADINRLVPLRQYQVPKASGAKRAKRPELA